MYNIDRIIEFENLMPALGLGFILGFMYDAVRILRLFVSRHKAFVFVTDALFVILCVLSSYLLFLSVNYGRIRAYLVIAIILGAVIYSCTAGEIIFSTAERISVKLKKLMKTVFSPLVFLFSKIKYFLSKILKIFDKKLKKFKIKSKKHLKDKEELLYNSND